MPAATKYWQDWMISYRGVEGSAGQNVPCALDTGPLAGVEGLEEKASARGRPPNAQQIIQLSLASRRSFKVPWLPCAIGGWHACRTK